MFSLMRISLPHEEYNVGFSELKCFPYCMKSRMFSLSKFMYCMKSRILSFDE